MAATRAGGSCMRCCSICRRCGRGAGAGGARLRRGAGHRPRARLAGGDHRRDARHRQRRRPSRPCSSREASPRCRSWRESATTILEGQIDRLAKVDGGLLILDYKTNRPPPKTLEEVAPAYIAQLAAYRRRSEGLYPGVPLRAALLWTDGPRLMEIPSTSLDAAEARILLQRATEP